MDKVKPTHRDVQSILTPAPGYIPLHPPLHLFLYVEYLFIEINCGKNAIEETWAYVSTRKSVIFDQPSPLFYVMISLLLINLLKKIYYTPLHLMLNISPLLTESDRFYKYCMDALCTCIHIICQSNTRFVQTTFRWGTLQYQT